MTKISRVALFGKLHPVLYKTIEAATVFAKLRGNPKVELGHWIHQLLLLDDCDLQRVLRHFAIDGGRLLGDVLQALERLPGGANAIEDLSGDIDHAVERAWVQASVNHGAAAVRSVHLLIALLGDKPLRARLLALSSEFARVDCSALIDLADRALSESPEANGVNASHTYGESLQGPGECAGAMAPAVMGRGEALRKYTVDLTERAREGEIDPVTGRDEEIRQIIDILMRRRQNNPLLTGEAGVGKTAVAEGLALRIAAADVPPALCEVELRSLDIGLLQAGASMKGEFEQRLRQLIDEVQVSAKPVILFIDEIHTLIGAGGAAGTGDAANLLKPALARGTLRTVGATTWSEYKRHIEKDPALTRRFQVVQVQEPDEARAIAMLRGIVAPLERHHGVRVLDEAIRAAVALSHRYIPARQLPDKAVALLDTAAARVAVSLHALPAELEDLQRRIEVLSNERTLLEREAATGIGHVLRLEQIGQQLTSLECEKAEIETRWGDERRLVEEIIKLREACFETVSAAGRAIDERPPLPDPSACPPCVGEAGEEVEPASETERLAVAEQMRRRLTELEASLRAMRGEQALVSAAVDEQVVASVVADWTGIPVGNMVRDEAREIIALADTLSRRVIGQRSGLEMIARRIQTARAGLSDPGKPVGVFLLCGPSGVGKTETALSLAERLYGGEQNLITINMSEFQEAHTVSTLKGAPPGYVGYGEGGVLTEAVRRRPYSVVLLDEVEKAHPDVHELFYQVFDKGRMEDGEGREIDFRNTVIILTSNLGTEVMEALCASSQAVSAEAIEAALRPQLLDVFPPALLGRLVVVPYRALSEQTLAQIVRLQLERIRARAADMHDALFEYDEAAVARVIARCDVAASGGRMIDAILTNTVLPEISHRYLQALTEGRRLSRIKLSADDDGFTYLIETCPLDAQDGVENMGTALETPGGDARDETLSTELAVG